MLFSLSSLSMLLWLLSLLSLSLLSLLIPQPDTNPTANFYISRSSRMSFVSLFMILEAVSLIFRWCATRRSPGVGSVEGGVVVGRRLRTLHTKATHELAKESCYMEAAQSVGRQRGLGCAGWRPRGDPWGGGPSTAPLAKLYSAALNSSSSLRLFPFLQ